MRHKMVSLCPTTYEKAQKIENFSKWVRDRLLEDDRESEERVKYFARCQRCGNTWSSYNNKRVPFDCLDCLREAKDPTVKRWTELESDL